MEELMKMSKKIILKTGLNKRAFFVARALGCNLLEVYYGDYKFNKVEDCKFAAILGNADFSGCENLDISKLKFVKGNLVVNDTANVSINVEYVGKNVFGVNAVNLNLPNLKEAGEGIYLNDATVRSLESLEEAKVLYANKHLVEKRSAFVVARSKNINKLDKVKE